VYIAGPPEPGVAVPDVVRALAGGDAVRPVWLNELGGLTCELAGPGGRRFVKHAPHGSGLDLAAEAARLTWAARWTRVPRVLGHGAGDTGEWLVTAALEGENAVAPRWLDRPATACAAIGRGLRALHDALPVADCPFSWSVGDRLRKASARGLGPDPGDPPPVDRLVVCHGDACAPNTLLDAAGHPAGHVDLGALGVADRWADLAVATWSTVWNYGPGHERTVLDAYGVDDDPVRNDWYRRLWDAT
jgi:kanamycin kinase